MILQKQFDHAQFVESKSVPSIVAVDPLTLKLVIGEKAAELSRAYRPVVQNFKWSIGESDAHFEGRAGTSTGSRAQKRWPVRYDGSETENSISTRDATKTFLQSFLGQLDGVPKQLIIGIPSTKDSAWAKQYRSHITSVLLELGFDAPDFFPEPFAVFQYYRHVEKLIPDSNQAMAVLIVDFGGGTTDSCVVEITNDGNLSKGGSTSLPLGIRSVVGAGKEVDRRLLKRCIQKSADARFRHESVSIDDRINSRPWVLLTVEQAKIALSARMAGFRLDDVCSTIKEQLYLPAGTYHPDVPVRSELTGDDLKEIIKELWFEKNGIGASIVSTIQEVRFRKGQVQLDQLDSAILAGGSAKLPFLKELLSKTLAGQLEISNESILIGEHSERAVAMGIAVEAASQQQKALRTHNSIGPCVFSELYFSTAPRRRETSVRPQIRRWHSHDNSPLQDGTLISGPMQVEDFNLEYIVELPFRPHGSLFYWFTDKSDEPGPEENRLNVQQDVLRLPPKADRKFRLRLQFDGERGLISPTFIFGKDELAGTPFTFGGLRLKSNVGSYVGVDFGTSNSYSGTLWAAPKEVQAKTDANVYPVYRLKEIPGERLRALEKKIEEARSNGTLNEALIREFSRKEQASFVFNSVKLEGNKLSFGETVSLLEGRKAAVSKEMLEPINVRDAYEFALENAGSLKLAPEGFIRELHKMVLKGISADCGAYRQKAVSLAGMDFTPPDWTNVEPFMERFGKELKQLDRSKSAVQLAAEAHCAFTSIHPFTDGNGRTARLIMNAILVEAGLPAITIAHSEKGRYLDALALSNKGDISELCILLAEAVEATLEQLAGNLGNEELLQIDAGADVTLKTWVPSQSLAAIMKARLEKAPVARKTRYEAWAAAFDNFREEFQTTCLGFNDLYEEALYHAEFTKFDMVPFEKYEDLLRRKPVPKTWLMGFEISSDIHCEKFVFWFRHISDPFLQGCKELEPQKLYPPAEVTLGVSRRVGGAFQSLHDEPIRLREAAYVNGEWLSLQCLEGQKFRIEKLNMATTFDQFLQDAILAYL